jgi:hypothetical protein
MESLKCKVCQLDIPKENYSLRLSNGKLQRYGKTCDKCRKEKNKEIYSSETFKKKNREKQNNYNKKRFFYSRAAVIVNRIKKNKGEVDYTVLELAKYLSSIWKKQNGLCELSGDVLTRYNAHVDHIITKNNGGTDNFSNFRWVTKTSNEIKGRNNDEELLIQITKIYNKLTDKAKNS